MPQAKIVLELLVMDGLCSLCGNVEGRRYINKNDSYLQTILVYLAKADPFTCTLFQGIKDTSECKSVGYR